MDPTQTHSASRFQWDDLPSEAPGPVTVPELLAEAEAWAGKHVIVSGVYVQATRTAAYIVEDAAHIDGPAIDVPETEWVYDLVLPGHFAYIGGGAVRHVYSAAIRGRFECLGGPTEGYELRFLDAVRLTMGRLIVEADLREFPIHVSRVAPK